MASNNAPTQTQAILVSRYHVLETLYLEELKWKKSLARYDADKPAMAHQIRRVMGFIWSASRGQATRGKSIGGRGAGLEIKHAPPEASAAGGEEIMK